MSTEDPSASVRCNTCWSLLTSNSVVVTACSHIFCHAHAVVFNSSNRCPACDKRLEVGEVKEVGVALEDFHMTLWGVNPSQISHISSLALEFWQYQKGQSEKWLMRQIDRGKKQIQQAQADNSRLQMLHQNESNQIKFEMEQLSSSKNLLQEQLTKMSAELEDLRKKKRVLEQRYKQISDHHPNQQRMLIAPVELQHQGADIRQPSPSVLRNTTAPLHHRMVLPRSPSPAAPLLHRKEQRSLASSSSQPLHCREPETFHQYAPTMQQPGQHLHTTRVQKNHMLDSSNTHQSAFNPPPTSQFVQMPQQNLFVPFQQQSNAQPTIFVGYPSLTNNIPQETAQPPTANSRSSIQVNMMNPNSSNKGKPQRPLQTTSLRMTAPKISENKTKGQTGVAQAKPSSSTYNITSSKKKGQCFYKSRLECISCQ